jgi:bifunctional ADP-heptose synthase (sugar kinase/adenylyltransferase)
LLNAHTGLEDQPRVDFINTRPLPEAVEWEVLKRLGAAVPDYQVILVADQAETAQGGVVTAGVRRLLADLAERYPEKVIWVDSRMRADQFRKVVIKPNREEAEAACRRLFGEVDYERLRRHVDSKLLVVTQGAGDVLVIEEGGLRRAPARRVAHPVDICGAGDSFSAGAALTLAATGSAVEAARFGNLVASITIMKKGTGTASPEEVLAAEEEGVE